MDLGRQFTPSALDILDTVSKCLPRLEHPGTRPEPSNFSAVP